MQCSCSRLLGAADVRMWAPDRPCPCVGFGVEKNAAMASLFMPSFPDLHPCYSISDKVAIVQSVPFGRDREETTKYSTNQPGGFGREGVYLQPIRLPRSSFSFLFLFGTMAHGFGCTVILSCLQIGTMHAWTIMDSVALPCRLGTGYCPARRGNCSQSRTSVTARSEIPRAHAQSCHACTSLRCAQQETS